MFVMDEGTQLVSFIVYFLIYEQWFQMRLDSKLLFQVFQEGESYGSYIRLGRLVIFR